MYSKLLICFSAASQLPVLEVIDSPIALPDEHLTLTRNQQFNNGNIPHSSQTLHQTPVLGRVTPNPVLSTISGSMYSNSSPDALLSTNGQLSTHSSNTSSNQPQTVIEAPLLPQKIYYREDVPIVRRLSSAPRVLSPEPPAPVYSSDNSFSTFPRHATASSEIVPVGHPVLSPYKNDQNLANSLPSVNMRGETSIFVQGSTEPSQITVPIRTTNSFRDPRYITQSQPLAPVTQPSMLNSGRQLYYSQEPVASVPQPIIYKEEPVFIRQEHINQFDHQNPQMIPQNPGFSNVDTGPIIVAQPQELASSRYQLVEVPAPESAQHYRSFPSGQIARVPSSARRPYVTSPYATLGRRHQPSEPVLPLPSGQRYATVSHVYNTGKRREKLMEVFPARSRNAHTPRAPREQRNSSGWQGLTTLDKLTQ